MFKVISSSKSLVIGLLGAGSFLAQLDVAHAYDMDCKVILCLAGGFPAGCGDAYSYMIKRITKTPKPLPPFGFCAMSDGSEYNAHNVSYRYLNRGPQAFDCPEGKTLFYRREDQDRAWNETVFCYSHSTTTPTYGRDGETQITYHNQSPATQVNFELNIVIEHGTAHEFRSPLYRINYATGYMAKRGL